MPNALILAANTATGAYLARLVQARGAGTFTVADETAADGLAALGVSGDVNPVSRFEAPELAASVPDLTVYAVNTGSTEQADVIDAVIAAAPTARLCHIADLADIRRNPKILDQVRAVTAMRLGQGRRAANAILHAHDSRLGPTDSLAARITMAAFRAAQGAAPVGLEIPETGAQDWGWTPEYVDAIARLGSLAAPLDIVIGSGHTLDVRQFVDLAFAFFKVSPHGHVAVTPGDVVSEAVVDTARIKAITGWSATTSGRDLVHALCEAVATRIG